MNKQEIENYNRLCAEFLGWKLISKEDFNKLGEASYTGESKDIKWGIIEYLKFHSDWNWIMEVVEAIEKISDWNLECLNVEERQFQMCIPLSNIYTTSKDKKEAVVESINQFLIWYNEKSN